LPTNPAVDAVHHAHSRRWRLRLTTPALAALMVTIISFPAWRPTAQAQPTELPRIHPGGLVRWPGDEISSCELGEDTWAPFDGSCWYPIDLLSESTEVRLARTRNSVREFTTIEVGPYPYPEQRLNVEPEMVTPPADQLDRINREAELVSSLWRSQGPAEFSLPLDPPVNPMPELRNFGSRRVFNGQPRSPHSGADLTAPAGTVVRAAGAGTVVLTGSHYYSGNSVFIDHGDGLVTMYFHLDRIDVEAGQRVDRGLAIGTVGATGRVTGAHLHFGVRWHGARIDPELLFSETHEIPKVGPEPL